MKKIFVVLLVLLFVTACKDEDNPLGDIINSKITAKEELSKVESKSQSEFSGDAELAAIFARDISLDGEIDLLDFSSVHGFIYCMQSDSKQDNRFYLPVYAAGPREIPFTLNDLTMFIEDEAAKGTVASALGLLAEVHISPSASYPDSDVAVQRFLSGGGQAFYNANSNTKVDLLLFPSKSISINGLENSADWIAHFYSADKSLVLWLNSGTNIVTEL